ncbi:MAG: hypothetical protein E7561_03220 [Ruminococcaceae bacterium]|nr:hypothetical protein [Oscillospiraceae bacterium]
MESQMISMFQILNDPLVDLMLSLSAENRKNREELLNKLKNIDVLQLFELCVEHELDGIVASHIMEDDLIELPEIWLEAYNKQKECQTFLKQKAIEVCGKMHENGIKMVILKNGGIMLDLIEDPAACPMEDVDSLVRKDDFYKAHEILLSQGFNFKFRSEFEFEHLEEAFKDGATEYYLTMPNSEKIWFELAWRAVAGRWIRPDLEPDTDLFIENSHTAKGTFAGVLSPEDNLLQVCIHTAKHSYVRAPGLRLHLDVDRIVSHCEIDWDLFLEKVKQSHTKSAIYLSLWIPTCLFDTQIPQYVLEALRPKKRKLMVLCKGLSNTGLLHPKQKKFSKLAFLRFQTAIYDSYKDVIKVIYPSSKWMKERYGYKSSFLTLKYILVRTLDLVGIRKKKASK